MGYSPWGHKESDTTEQLNNVPIYIYMQGYWSGLPFPSLGDLLYLEIKPKSPSLQHRQTPYLLDSEPPGKHIIVCVHVCVCVCVCVTGRYLGVYLR